MHVQNRCLSRNIFFFVDADLLTSVIYVPAVETCINFTFTLINTIESRASEFSRR